MSVQYLVPLTIISYTYITISTRLWWSSPPGHQTPGQDRENLMKKRKIVQMLILVVVIFSSTLILVQKSTLCPFSKARAGPKYSEEQTRPVLA